MSLQIKGVVQQILPEVSGESRNGPWKKREIIIQTDDEYPQMVCLTQWGNSIDTTQDLAVEDVILATFSLSSREYNGRWYTDVKAYRVDIINESSNPSEDSGTTLNVDDDADLPF